MCSACTGFDEFWLAFFVYYIILVAQITLCYGVVVTVHAGKLHLSTYLLFLLFSLHKSTWSHCSLMSLKDIPCIENLAGPFILIKNHLKEWPWDKCGITIILPVNTQGEPLGCKPRSAVISLGGMYVGGNGPQVLWWHGDSSGTWEYETFFITL